MLTGHKTFIPSRSIWELSVRDRRTEEQQTTQSADDNRWKSSPYKVYALQTELGKFAGVALFSLTNMLKTSVFL